MCLGIPYEVAERLDDDSCLVRVGSGVQHCFTGLVEDVAVGDWLVVHAGCAVEKITPAVARENLRLIQSYLFGEGSVGEGSVGEGSVGEGSVGEGSVAEGDSSEEPVEERLRAGRVSVSAAGREPE